MCHSRRNPYTVRDAHEPDLNDDLRRAPDVRASDAERDDVAARLRVHAAAGRLDVGELEDRVGAVYAAGTRGELASLLEDLPREPALRPAARRHATKSPGGELGVFLAVVILLVGIWAATGAGFFWPVWVIGWWGVALAVKLPVLARARATPRARATR